MTFMPKAAHRRATSPPILPAPIRPSVRPRSSTPLKLDRSHAPVRIDASAAETFRTIDRIKAIVSSAAETVLPAGAFTTATPRSVAASKSMLSTPTPARPMTRRCSACASISPQTLVALRTTRPCASFRASAKAGSDESSILITSKRASARSGSRPVSDTLSVTTTLKVGVIGSPRSILREVRSVRRANGRPCVRFGWTSLSASRSPHQPPNPALASPSRSGVRSIPRPAEPQ